MTLDLDRVDAITFDSFTTLVDVHGTTERALRQYVDDPTPIVRRWRSRAVAYRLVSNFVGYEPYMQTTREALTYALAAHDVDLPAESIDEIARTFHALEVFDDVADAMAALDGLGYDLYVVSNGEVDLLESIVERAGVESQVRGLVSADEIGTYKPDERFYRHAAERIDVPIERVAHVATPWYDVFGAMHAGMQGVWVNRRDAPWEAYDGAPDLTVADLDALVERFER